MTRGISSKKRGATSLSQAASVSHRGYRSVGKGTNHLRKDGVFLSQMIASCTEISPPKAMKSTIILILRETTINNTFSIVLPGN